MGNWDQANRSELGDKKSVVSSSVDVKPVL